MWKKDDNKISIFCDLNERLKYEKQDIQLNTIYFNYNNYTIAVYEKDYISVKRLEYNIPFLYANEQTINIVDEKDNYEIIFKCGNYYEFDKCEINPTTKELICQITKEKLEEIMTEYKSSFKLGSMNDNYGLWEFNYVSNINVNYEKFSNISLKEDLYIGLIKVIELNIEVNGAFYLETNITAISNLNVYTSETCKFKKVALKPLMVICNFSSEGDFIFGNYSEEIVISNIHYKYNFRIQPYDLQDIVKIRNQGTMAALVYPEVKNWI